MTSDLRNIAGHFAVEGELTAVEPFGGGHINESFLLTYRHEGGVARFLLQHLNQAVFPSPALVMDNIRRVTGHIRRQLESSAGTDLGRRLLRLVHTHDGSPCCRDGAGGCWRLYVFIEGTRGCQTVDTPELAERAGRAFGRFQALLIDIPGPRLHETIPGFHHTPSRFAALERAIQADPHGRLSAARAEAQYASRHRPLAAVLSDLHEAGDIPERVVHNDAKIGNLLLDARTGEPLCVVDLDTVMPGLAPHDFGDMVRSMTCPAPEDETDLSRVEVSMPLFEALARGYLQAAAAFLTPAERANLLTAGKLITLEQGVRFLTDFLNGDTYYRIQRPNHNLDRCRTQFRLFASIVRHEREMARFVAGL